MGTRQFHQAAKDSGYPKTFPVEQRAEFIFSLSAYQHVELGFSRLDRSTDNAFIESFNGKFPENA